MPRANYTLPSGSDDLSSCQLNTKKELTMGYYDDGVEPYTIQGLIAALPLFKGAYALHSLLLNNGAKRKDFNTQPRPWQGYALP